MKRIFTLKRVLILLSLIFCSDSLIAQRAVVGAIRWDAWYDSSIPYATLNAGEQVETSLGPSQFHFRVPYFGSETGTNSVHINGNTQAIMDQEIAYAKKAGIDYWAFVYYPDSLGLDYARKLYYSSTHKNDVKACFILDGNFVFDTNHVNWLVARMKESNYQTVLSGRPMVYIFGSSGYTAANITALRNTAAAQSAGNPYVVYMADAAGATAIGADAISNYVNISGSTTGIPYSNLMANEQSTWNSQKNSGKKVIPCVTTGWDPRPRILHPPTWGGSGNAWTETATADEIAAELQAGLDFVAANPTVVEANAIIMYAWNEHDEGGWLCPTITIGNNSVPDTSRLKAITAVLNPPPGNQDNLALNKTYSSSSNWDGTQTADKAFDGSPATNWQSVIGSGFNNQWLAVNFGSSTTFNKVILSEYGNRTAGFRIEYNNGSGWQTAYTGTSIGVTDTIVFAAVTGSQARIYFTSGTYTPIIIEFEIYHFIDNGPNLALSKTYSSSSNWDGTQTAGKACDGNQATNWQSASGAFAGQWVAVNFGASATFNKVILSEYGSRTTGYRIEYSSNGSTWQTAYTGTTIGTSKTISFTEVTGNYARIYFTGGLYTPIIFEFEIYHVVTSTTNLALNRTYASSSNWDGTQTAGKACDANPSTDWQSASGSFAGQWMSVNFGASTTFDKVVLSEYGNRTAGYRIEYSSNGTTWQTAYTGTSIGVSSTATFPAVTANYARIYFTSGSNTPIIYEFEIYNTAGGGGGVSNSFSRKWLVYPNPVGDRLTIQSPAGSSGWTYQFFSIQGNLLEKGAVNAGENLLHLGRYTPGVYILQLTSSKGEKIVQRIIRQ